MLVLQAQLVLLNEPQELPYLIGFCLTTFGLKVEHLWHIGVDEEVMTASYSVQLEPEALDQVYYVTESNIPHCAAGQPTE
jgi:hypothetical protein